MILKEPDVIKTNVKKFFEKLKSVGNYGILECTYVSKNSNKMAKIQKSKLNNSLTN